jgi:ParB-like nuclease domain
LVLIFGAHPVLEIKMSEFEPLNIAHYQQPTTPLSDGAAPYMDWIEVKRLVTDKTYQREISRAGSINVERIAEYFEWAKFSPVIVAPVEGGMFSIIDGQHRATAAMLRGIEKVPCEIVHIDRARQAEAFAAINGNITRVSAQVVYYARLTGKDPEAEEMARVLSAAEVTVCRGAKTLRTMKRGETNAVGAISKLLNKFGPETIISALQCITQTGSGNPGFLRAMIMEPLCVVLHRNPKWRDSGERLLREMDSFDFIEAWDAAVKERQTVPSVTTQMLIADAVTAHLTTAMSKKNAA